MTPADAGRLLAIAASVDNRKPDPDAALAWSVMLDGYRFEDCRDVIVEHYRRSREWLMPSDIINAVRRLRDKRLAEAPAPIPPPDLTPMQTIAWIKVARRRIADGEPVVESEGRGELEDRRDVVAELGQAGTSIAEDNAATIRKAREAAATARREAQAARKPEPEPLLTPDEYSREPESATAINERTTR